MVDLNTSLPLEREIFVLQAKIVVLHCNPCSVQCSTIYQKMLSYSQYISAGAAELQEAALSSKLSQVLLSRAQKNVSILCWFNFSQLNLLISAVFSMADRHLASLTELCATGS